MHDVYPENEICRNGPKLEKRWDHEQSFRKEVTFLLVTNRFEEGANRVALFPINNFQNFI